MGIKLDFCPLVSSNMASWKLVYKSCFSGKILKLHGVVIFDNRKVHLRTLTNPLALLRPPPGVEVFPDKADGELYQNS